MSEITEVIEKIRAKYFELLDFNSGQEKKIAFLQQQLQEKEEAEELLQRQKDSLEGQIEVLREDNFKNQEVLKEQIVSLQEQLRTLGSVETTNVEEIVREIDDCINLIKNNL